MGKFKQKINEQSIVQPSGFTGVIIDNSKIVIDKTYIEKGTSFVNAFNNSNVILKDCGSPEPIVDSNENIVIKTTSKLKTESDKRTLPFWVHSKIARFDSLNTAINEKNGSLVYLEDVSNEVDMNDEKYKRINDFRTTIESNIVIDEKTNESVVDVQYMLEQQIMRDNVLTNGLMYSTKDIDYTRAGKYCLSGVTSSIKAVWTLDNIRKTNLDNPCLNLNYINREIFPYTSNTKKEIKINGVNKVDSFGQEIEIPNLSSEMISPNTFKKIVESRVNNPILRTDINGNNIPVSLPADSNGAYLNFKYKTKENSTNGKYYFSGPYLNDKSYISYYKNDRTTNSKILQNDVENLNETRFFVNFEFNEKNETFDLFELINDPTLSGSDINSASGYLWNFYLNKNINYLNGKLYLNEFTESTKNHNPDDKTEICNFYGFKFNNDLVNEKISEDKVEYFLDKNGQDITSEVLLSGRVDISTENGLNTIFKSYYLESPTTTSIPVSVNDSCTGIILVNDEYILSSKIDGLNVYRNAFYNQNTGTKKYSVTYYNTEISASVEITGYNNEFTYNPSGNVITDDNGNETISYYDPSLSRFSISEKDLAGYISSKEYFDTAKEENNAYLLLDCCKLTKYLTFEFSHVDLFLSSFVCNYTCNQLSGSYVVKDEKDATGVITGHTHNYNFIGNDKLQTLSLTSSFVEPSIEQIGDSKEVNLKKDNCLTIQNVGSIFNNVLYFVDSSTSSYILSPPSSLNEFLSGNPSATPIKTSNVDVVFGTTVKYQTNIYNNNYNNRYDDLYDGYKTTNVLLSSNIKINNHSGLSGVLSSYITSCPNNILSGMIGGVYLSGTTAHSKLKDALNYLMNDNLDNESLSSILYDYSSKFEDTENYLIYYNDENDSKNTTKYEYALPIYKNVSEILSATNLIIEILSGDWSVSISNDDILNNTTILTKTTEFNGEYVKLSKLNLNRIKEIVNYFKKLDINSINSIKLFDNIINSVGFHRSYKFNAEKLREYVLNEIKNTNSGKDSSINYANDLVEIGKKVLMDLPIRQKLNLSNDGKHETILAKFDKEYLDKNKILNDDDLTDHFIQNYVTTDKKYLSLLSNTQSEDFTDLNNITFDKINFKFLHSDDDIGKEYIIGNPDTTSLLSTQYLTAYIAFKYSDKITINFVNDDMGLVSSNVSLKKSEDVGYEIKFNDNVFNNIIDASNFDLLKEKSKLYNNALYLNNFIINNDGEFSITGTFTDSSSTNDYDAYSIDINDDNIGCYVSSCFEEAKISPSSLFYDLSGVYKNGDLNIFYVESPFIEKDGNIKSKYSDEDIYVYSNGTGQKLTRSIISDEQLNSLLNDPFYISYDVSGNLLCVNSGPSKIQLLTKCVNNLILFFDKDCRIPFEFDADNKKLYDHTKNGQKIYKLKKFDESNVSNGEVLKYNFEYINEFQYKYETLKELANFNDWYNVNTYINYNKINSSEGLNYTCKIFSDTCDTLQRIKGSVTTNYEEALIENTFKDGCFEIAGNYPYYTNNIIGTIKDDRTLMFNSNCQDSETDIVVNTNLKSITSGYQNNFSSLFIKDDVDNYQGYKMFSFNFFIPKEGWNIFDEHMYKANPYYMSDIRRNGESTEFMWPSRDELSNSSYKSDAARFEGYFLVGYNVFNKRVKQDMETVQHAISAVINDGNKRDASADFGFISDDFTAGQYSPIVSCGHNHTVIVSADRKRIYAAGLNNLGQLGLDSSTYKSTIFQDVTDRLPGITITDSDKNYIVGAWAIYDTTFVLVRKNNENESSCNSYFQESSNPNLFSLYATGYNGYHNLGLANDSSSKYGFIELTQSSGFGNISNIIKQYGIKSIAGYYYYTVIVTGNGTLYSIGSDSSYVQGNENSGNNFSSFAEIGNDLKVENQLSSYLKVQCGCDHCIALGSNGKIAVWGIGNHYCNILGYNVNKPTIIDGNHDVIINENVSSIAFNNLYVTDIAVKGYTSFLIARDRGNDEAPCRLYACGHNDCGLAGTGGTKSSLRLTKIDLPSNDEPKFVIAGLHTAYVISSTGVLYSAGRNHVKQLGHNTKTSFYKEFTRVDVNGTGTGLATVNVLWTPDEQTMSAYDVINLKPWDAGYDGADKFFVGFTGNGENYLYGFGQNTYGQLGIGSTFECIDYEKQYREEQEAIAKSVKEYYGFDSYNKALITSQWTALIKNQNRKITINGEEKTSTKQLTLTSTNESLRFTVDLFDNNDNDNVKVKSYDNVYNLSGLSFSASINGANHNVIIPNLEIYIRYYTDTSDSSLNTKNLFMSTIYKNPTSKFGDEKVLQKMSMHGISETLSSDWICNYKLMNSNKADKEFFDELYENTKNDVHKVISSDFNNALLFSNFSPIKTKNEFSYPHAWISPGHIGFSNKEYFNTSDNFGIGYDDMNFVIDCNFEKENNNKGIYDLEPFVKPFDMSTNLFYYKGSETQDRADDKLIKANDEVIIINARKMYNPIPAGLQKPVDSNLDLNLDDLYNTEIVLTGFVPIDSNDSNGLLEEVYPYVNNLFEYQVSTENALTSCFGNDNKIYKQCRYTDYLGTADQWKLFKLSDDIIFTTINDFNMNLNASIDQKTNSSDDANKLLMPCKLSLSFNGLYFKQRIRTGVEHDNVSDITYLNRIFGPNSFLRDVGEDLSGELSARWKLTTIGVPSATQISTTDDGLELKTLSEHIGYIISEDLLNDYSSENLFGGSNYYNDLRLMATVSNSVNKWVTETHDNKFSDLMVFSDYYPSRTSTEHASTLFGSPYLNLRDTYLCKYDVNTGTSTSEGGNRLECEHIVETVKVATDERNILIINDISEKLEDYPLAESNLIDKNIKSYVKDVSGKKLICEIAGHLNDISIIGLKRFGLTSATSSVTIKSDEINNKNVFGIYFDGLLYEKEVYLINKNSIIEYNKNDYLITSILFSNVKVEKNGNFGGIIEFEIMPDDSYSSAAIEIHNIKLPSPKINKIGLTYSDSIISSLDAQGYYTCDENTWQRKIMFNGSNSLVDVSDLNLETLFTLQSENEIQSTTNLVYDDDGQVSGMLISLKIPGLKRFKTATSGFFLENQFETILSSKEMLSSYQGLSEFNLSGYNSNANIGSTITSGSLNFEYNKIVSNGLGKAINSIGKIKYVYNPIGKNDFQLEVITKAQSGHFNKELYYVNLPVGNWYNMCIYKWTKESNTSLTADSSKLGFILDKINYYDEYSINNSGCNELFKCIVTNDGIIEGTDIYSNKTYTELSAYITADPGKSLYRYDTKSNISFDPCSRTPWKSYYSSDVSNLINSDEIITDIEYNERKGKDIWNIGEYSFNNNNSVSSFKNKFGTIKLFANDELSNELNLGLLDTFGNKNISGTQLMVHGRYHFINYAPSINGNVSGNTDYASLSMKSINEGNFEGNNSNLHYVLNQMIPRKIMLNDSEENYVLRYKDNTYHINAVPGLKCKNVMFVNSPNLSNRTNSTKYYENYNDALNAVNEYIDFFNHPEHRLPPVTYKNHILSSDYASYIYNSCKKYVAINNESVEHETKTLMYDYKKNPDIIAYVWGNSQVSRIESVRNGVLQESKLNWTKSSADEYISEVGSLYNFKESQHMTNIVKIEAGSINERQTVLMPVLTEPFEFEQRTSISGLVKVTDRIIATAALGYNSNGYPVNSVLQYNTNGSTNINTTQTSYLYVSQDDNLNNCIFGSTEQKPVYVDAIQQNTQSLCEKFKFLPNPTISEGLTGEDVDKLLIKYFGGNLLTDNANETVSRLFNIGEIQISDNANSHINVNNFGCYYSIGQIKAHSVYTYKTNSVNTYTNKTSNGKYVTFIGNLLTFGGVSDTSINKESLNVFYNEKEFEELVNESEGIQINKPLVTMNCFTYDGQLLTANRFNDGLNKIGNLGEDVDSFNDLVDLLKNYGLLYDYKDKFDLDLEPSFGVIWMNNESRTSDYSEFYKNITKDLGENENNRHAIFDEYYSTNITGVKFKINEENLQSAPIYIKISLLKAVENNNNIRFVWVNDPILDINLLDNYENIFDYSTASDREIEKSFVTYPGNEDLLRHVFGIKFTIKQIVPQQNEFNKCIIDNCEIYTSNMLDKYGISNAIEDVFIRKADANCRNNYKMEVNEYIWTLPTNVAEWHTVYDILSADYYTEQELIDSDSYMLISGSLENLSKPIESTITDQLADGDRFSYMTTYYFTNANESKSKVTEILSDNYLANSNIKISWKYIDYVYISYSCYSPNSMELLDLYFGQKIFEAVKSKLLDNIDNLNSNSAFKDKYRFSGGIAKQKSDFLDTKKHTGAFTWSNSFTQENWTEYQNVYQEDFTNVKKYGTEIYRTNYYRNGSQYATETWTGEVDKLLSDVTTSSGIYQSGRNTLRSNQIQTSTSVLKNLKYSSVENWTKTFMPIAIKYKIN